MNVNNISKERFEKAKKGIIKKYPGAKTMVDPQGKYYVATADGRDICNLQVGQTINSYDFDGEDDLYGFNSNQIIDGNYVEIMNLFNDGLLIKNLIKPHY